jgi:hypothetical protein
MLDEDGHLLELHPRQEKALLARARDANAVRRELDDLRRVLERVVEEANTAAESLELATAKNARL